MYTVKTQTSKRQYGIVHERDVAIPVRAGFTLDADIFRPDSNEKFPAILSIHPFDKAKNIEPMIPIACSKERVPFEAGDPLFYARRGYVHVIASLRGTGKSGGEFDHMRDGTIEDMYDVIEWLAKQPWCDGQVATFGTSYFSMTAKRVAELKPPSLKTIFAPFAVTDQYRQAIFPGGIFSYAFHHGWLGNLSNLRMDQSLPERMGKEVFEKRIQEALEDPEINIHPELVDVLKNPYHGGYMLIAEYILNYLDGPGYRERSLRGTKLDIPAYFGGCWAMHSLHLPGDFFSFENWNGPKKLTIGPPYYLDRPVYQYHYESLRWFDHWLKGIDTGLMDEDPVQLFIQNSDDWKSAKDWPLPETLWTEFYLHNDGLLSEHEFWPDDAQSTFKDAPDQRGSVTFLSPPIVENTEVCGPLALNFYASTTDTEALWFINLLQIDDQGHEKVLTRGWLRGSQRRLDPEKSKPWQPYHKHEKREPLTPGEIYEFNVEIAPTGVLLKRGYRLGVRIKAADVLDKPTDFLDVHGLGHLWRTTPAEITVYHSDKHPSHLLVPITKGNRVGTFMSGGVLGPMKGH